MIYLVKLVRDRVGDLLGDQTVLYQPITDHDEAVKQLRAKLVEEAVEYIQQPSLEELADVLEVVKALALVDLGESWIDVEGVAEMKERARGGFRGLVGMFAGHQDGEQ